MAKRRTISVVVLNEHSVLARISGLFAGRGYNIESLTVAPIPDSNFSRLTIVTFGNEKVLEQITKQLHKLIPVLKVIEHEDIIEKEMILIKFPVEGNNLSDIDTLCKIYNGKILNVPDNFIIAMVADAPRNIENFLKAVKRFSPKDIVRGGVVSVETV
jgi:acetolactate synthase-1/3 small subunit